MDEQAEIQPLTFAQKVRTGIKGFLSSAISYIPRGVVVISALFAASALTGSMFGADFLGVASSYANNELVGKFVFTLLLGGAISGGLGAMQSVDDANKQREQVISTQAELQRCRQCGPEKMQQAEHDVPAVPTGLPMGKPSHKPMVGYN